MRKYFTTFFLSLVWNYPRLRRRMNRFRKIIFKSINLTTLPRALRAFPKKCIPLQIKTGFRDYSEAEIIVYMSLFNTEKLHYFPKRPDTTQSVFFTTVLPFLQTENVLLFPHYKQCWHKHRCTDSFFHILNYFLRKGVGQRL